MITEAIDKILSLADVRTLRIGENTYVKSDQQIRRLIRPEDAPPKPIVFKTLTGFADYIEANPDGLDIEKTIIHVSDFNRVHLIGPMQPENENARFVYAMASDSRRVFPFRQWFPIEDFIIALQSDFSRVPDFPDDADDIIHLVGTIASEHVKTQEDDGFTQRVQIQSGLTTKSEVKVENPVYVRPWRTFGEILQPGTPAILRFQNRVNGPPHVALFDSGGEDWRLKAIALIKTWLESYFPEMNILA